MPASNSHRAVAESLAAAARDRRKKAIPDPNVLAEYAAQLPPIYRHILAAFQDAQPGRLAGESLAAATIQMHLRNAGMRYETPDIIDACLALVAQGFLDDTSRAFESFGPTPVGEALIAAVTGRAAPAHSVPPLPAPTW